MQIGVICAAKGMLPGPADERELAGRLGLAASHGISCRLLPSGAVSGPPDARMAWRAAADVGRWDGTAPGVRQGCRAALDDAVASAVVVPGGSGFTGQAAVAGRLLVVPGGGEAGPPPVDLDQAGF